MSGQEPQPISHIALNLVGTHHYRCESQVFTHLLLTWHSLFKVVNWHLKEKKYTFYFNQISEETFTHSLCNEQIDFRSASCVTCFWKGLNIQLFGQAFP